MKIFLLCLSLLGAGITTASSIWSATHKLSVDQPDGTKILLPSGKLSIGLTVLGLVIAFSSGLIGYHNTRQEALAKAFKDAEEQRTADEKERNKEFKDILRENRLLLGQELQTGIVNAYNTYLINEATLESQKREMLFTRDIILSGQPLRSLSLSWTFEDVNPPLAKKNRWKYC